MEFESASKRGQKSETNRRRCEPTDRCDNESGALHELEADITECRSSLDDTDCICNTSRIPNLL